MTRLSLSPPPGHTIAVVRAAMIAGRKTWATWDSPLVREAAAQALGDTGPGIWSETYFATRATWLSLRGER